jgi:hypothetical protein
MFEQMQFVNAVAGGTYSDTKTYADVMIKFAQASVSSLINRRKCILIFLLRFSS